MKLGLEAKVCVVTGATANIGRAIALELAENGASILAVGRDREAGAKVVAAALAAGAAGAEFAAIDLTERDAGERVRAATHGAFGRVDVLVNNVGGNVAIGPFAESDPESWAHDIDITLGTMLRVTRAVLPGMIAQGSGAIVNIGSTAGLVGDTMLSVYSAAKGAVHTFTRVLAKEVGKQGVRVNAVAPYSTMAADPEAYSSGSRFAPGGFFTRAHDTVTGEDMAAIARAPGPLGRQAAVPEEVAALVAYLASDRAAFTTGEVMTVSGGVLL